jgi:hypothetical protein
MRFIIPKPIHGWRAFWGEVGIIVLGVLIALGAQQLAEDWSDRRQTQTTMAALRAEIAEHNDSYMTYQIVAPCVYAQIDAIEQKLASGSMEPLTMYHEGNKLTGYVVRVPTQSFATAAWRAAENDNQLRLLDPKVASIGAAYYGRFENIRHFNLDAITQFSALSALAIKMPSTDADRMQFLVRLEQLREDMSRLELAANQSRKALASIGMIDPDAQLDPEPPGTGTMNFCRAHAMPMGKVVPVESKTQP